MITELLSKVKKEAIRKRDLHLISKDAILDQAEKNLTEMTSLLNDDLKTFNKLNGSVPNSIEGLKNYPIKDTSDLKAFIREKKSNVFLNDASSGWRVTNSSGTSSSEQIVLPYDLRCQWNVTIQAGRPLTNNEFTENDCLLCLEAGKQQGGYIPIQNHITWVGPGSLASNILSTSKEKIDTVKKQSVNWIAGTPKTVTQFANAYFRQEQKSLNAKKIILTGAPATEEQMNTMKKYLGTSFINMYGIMEMGNIAWTCNAGQQHVNIDFVNVSNRDGKTIYDGLSLFPIFNYHVGDNIEYEWNGKCDCGSYLPTVTKFSNKFNITTYKDKIL